MNCTKFKGIFTALITPFTADGQELDLKAFRNLVDWQIDQGIHGLVPCGTTGETPVLSDDEYKSIIDTCIDVANKRVPIIVGAGSNNTNKSIAMAEYAKNKGADAILVVAPYYNKPTQQGILAHYKSIASATDLPLITYNIPGRSVINIEPNTLKELSKVDHIIGVKDATGDLTRPTQTRLQCGADFLQLSGEDATIAGYLAQGGHGSISVSSNIAPKLYRAMYDAWEQKDITTFEMIRDRLHPLAEAMFIEASPAPVKFGLSTLGLCESSVRLPLVQCSDLTQKIIKDTLNDLELAQETMNRQAHGG